MKRWQSHMTRVLAAATPILAAVLLLYAPQIARSDGPGDWPMFRHDPAHSGYNANETQLKPPLRLKWSYQTDGPVTFSPTISDGVVYVDYEKRAALSSGPTEMKVLSLDASTGALHWIYSLGTNNGSPAMAGSSPAVAGSVVYAGSWADNKLYALDSGTGTLKWSYTTGGGILSSPTVVEGVVYVGSGDYKVYALDAVTGALKWSYATGSYILSSPAVVEGVVYVGSQDGKVYALDAATGSLKWSYQTDSSIESSPLLTNGVVYIGSSDGKVHALDAMTGALRWTYSTGGLGISSAAVAGSVVYVGSRDGKLYALDADSGILRWSYSTGGPVLSPALANGVVYVGSGDGKLYALDASTGDPKWSYSTGVYPDLAVANGVLYVSGYDGKVYAFESDSGVAPTPTSAPTPTPTLTPTPTPAPSIPDLAVVNLATKEKAYPGDTLAYLIFLDNSGPTGITVALTDTIPAGATYVFGTLSGGAVYNATINSILWSGVVPPGQSSLPSTSFSFRVRIDPDLSANAITNTVLVSDGAVTTTASAMTEVWRRTFAPLVVRSYESGW
ncbi:MAG: PQQ-binding-like beta-propeller repeat protein [Dehalococcoidia bacterium]|nr:PQQ-binding-like beta-propeller repeat protein [Dehalococcoidia bacterium]